MAGLTAESKRHRTFLGSWSHRVAQVAFLFLAAVLPSIAAAIDFTPKGTFQREIGIDYSEHEGNPIVTYDFNASDGSGSKVGVWDRVTGQIIKGIPIALSEENKVATVRQVVKNQQGILCDQQWPVGTIFTGTGVAGQIAKLEPQPDGTYIVTPAWVTIQGETIFRGGFFHDRFCEAGGDLIVVSGNGTQPTTPTSGGGNVYRINGAGGVTLLKHIDRPAVSGDTGPAPAHLEGVIVVPNIPATYGLWAGKIVTGDEDRSFLSNGTAVNGPNPKIYAIDVSNGNCSQSDNGILSLSCTPTFHVQTNVAPGQVAPPGGLPHPEDFDFIEGDFYGVAFNDSDVSTPKDQGHVFFAPFADFNAGGNILITQEYPVAQIFNNIQVDVGANSGLYQVRWDGAQFVATELVRTNPGTCGLTPDNKCLSQWEHVTFVPTSDITFTKSPKNATFAFGGQLTFTLVVTSTGPGTATHVVVDDQLPTTGGLTWTVDPSSNLDQGESCTISAGQLLHCALNPLVAGDSVQIVLKSQVNTPAAACNGVKINNIGTAQADGTTVKQDTGDYTCTPTPNVTIIKFTNGADANDPNAAGVPNISAGGVVTWTYRVTNTGQTSVPRANVVVTDNVTGVTPTFTSEISGNGDTIFNPGEVWLYTATGTALNLTLPPPAGTHTVANSCTAGGTQPPRTAYTNIGTVTIPGATANDPSSYCNPPTPNVTIIKFTNGADANDPNAAGVPNISAGGVVTWTYRVTNTGNVAVPRANVVVTDSATGVTPTFTSVITGNADTIFDPGEVWLYTATGTALDLTLAPPAGVTTVPNSCTAGGTQPPRTAYTNIGTVTIPGASATDPSSYCNPPPAPGVTIIKFTNGADANDPNSAGAQAPANILAGGVVTWTYRVTNTGNTSVPRANVVVTDNVTGVTPTFTSEITGNGDTTFNPGEVWLYSATGTALNLALPPPAGTHTVANSCTAGGTQPPRTAYTNIGTVTIPGASATDPSSYCNPPTPNVTIIKYTNTLDANDPNAGGGLVPNVATGGAVTWTYKVTNTGNTSVPRAQVLVTDDHTGVTPTFTSEITGNGDTIFNPGEVWLYTATGTALDLSLQSTDGVKFIANSCTAGGTQPPRTAYKNKGTVTIPGATANDPSSYCNPPPHITLTKTPDNGTFNVGDTLKFTIVVTSDGAVGSTAHNVKILNDALPTTGGLTWTVDTANTTFPGCSVTAQVLNCVGPLNLAKGSSATVVVKTTNSSGAPAAACTGNKLINTATATSTDAGSSTDTGDYTCTVCVPTTFAFTGNTASTGTAGNIRTFTVNGISVKASAFSRVNGANGAWANAYLGLYGPGLGVTDSSESGNDPTHKVDNIGGRNNYVLFEFSKPVVIDRVFLDAIGADSDMSVWIGTKTDPFNNHLTLSDSLLSSLGLHEDNLTSATVTSRWADINGASVSGNVLVIAAWDADDTPEDAFKISKLDITCGATSCPATSGNFDFSGNTSTTGTAGNIRTFTVNGVSVKASAFSRVDSNQAWSTAYLGLYGPGLGVTDSSESGNNPTHKVDNIGGRHNFVLFEFSAPIVVDQVFLDSIGADSDMSVWIGTKTDPFNNHLTLSNALLSSLFTEDNNTSASVTSRWANINAGNLSGNVLVIAASVSDTTPDDEFKISKVAFNCK